MLEPCMKLEAVAMPGLPMSERFPSREVVRVISAEVFSVWVCFTRISNIARSSLSGMAGSGK